MLSQKQIQILEEILFDEEQETELFDYFSLHGLVCACIVSPKEYSKSQIFSVIFEDISANLTPEQRANSEKILSTLIDTITHTLLQGEQVPLPHADQEEHEEEAINHWCVGFIEGFLLDEALWFEDQAEIVAELLLPFMVLSELFDDEDFQEIKQNEILIDQFYENLSDALTDLFLFYHSNK